MRSQDEALKVVPQLSMTNFREGQSEQKGETSDKTGDRTACALEPSDRHGHENEKAARERERIKANEVSKDSHKDSKNAMETPTKPAQEASKKEVNIGQDVEHEREKPAHECREVGTMTSPFEEKKRDSLSASEKQVVETF